MEFETGPWVEIGVDLPVSVGPMVLEALSGVPGSAQGERRERPFQSTSTTGPQQEDHAAPGHEGQRWGAAADKGDLEAIKVAVPWEQEGTRAEE